MTGELTSPFPVRQYSPRAENVGRSQEMFRSAILIYIYGEGRVSSYQDFWFLLIYSAILVLHITKIAIMAEFHFLNKTQPPQVTKLNLPENTSCVLLKKRNIVVKPKPMPILQPDGVLVKVVATDKFIHCKAMIE